MRRYGEQTPGVTVPGRDAGLKLTLQPAAEPAEPCAEPEPCEPAITGLFWFSDSTGLFDQDVEAAYLLAEGAAGPVLAVAALVGESCDLPVAWTKVWTPASGDGGDPGYLEDGARLIVYPLADTAPGVLEVTAEHGGQSYGPIMLTVLRYSCYCYGYSDKTLAWFDAFSVFAASNPQAVTWQAGGKPCTPTSNSGQCNATLALRAGYELTADTMRLRITYIPTTSPEGPWEFRFYLHTVEESFYYYHTDPGQKIVTVPASYSQLSLYFPGDWVNGTLSLQVECYGPPGEALPPAGGE